MKSEKNTIDVSRLCRTCATEYSTGSPLFGLNSDGAPGFGEMLSTCTNFKVLNDDDLPKSICDDCIGKLKAAYQFACQYRTAKHCFKQLGLKSIELDHISIYISKDKPAIFMCRECYMFFNTFEELNNHKSIHSINETVEEKGEFSIIEETVDFKDEESEDGDLAEVKEEPESGDDGGEDNISDLLVEEFDGNDIEGNSEANVIGNVMNEKLSKGTSETVGIPTETKEQDGGSLTVAEFIANCSSSDDRNLNYSSHDDNNNLDRAPLTPWTTLSLAENAERQKTLQSHRLSKESKNEQSCFNEQTHSGMKYFKCEVCEKSYANRKILREHKQTHSGIKSFLCDVCGELFASSSSFYKHKRARHIGMESLKCNVCKKSYSNRKSLREHKQTHHGMTFFKCDVCEKWYSNIRSFQQHKRKRHGAKFFKCIVCRKSYSTREKLLEHKRANSGLDSFLCDVCGKLLSNSNGLWQHKHTHKEKRAYVCDICEQPFTHPSSLCKHKKKHRDNSFKCNVCEKSYSNQQILWKHKLTHCEIKSFRCDVCERLYLSRSSLRRHKQMHKRLAEHKSDVPSE